MSQHDNDRETRINELLDGELDEAAAEALKAEAGEDRELAQAIVEAYRLQRAMDTLGTERAPASLRKRLRRIPREQRPAWRQPRWAFALAAVPVALLSLVLLQSRGPSVEEVRQARQDLAVAFAYIDRVGNRTSNQLESRLNQELGRQLTEILIENVPGQDPDPKEEQA